MSVKQQIGMVMLRYLRWCAKKQLQKNPSAIIIGITGSAGKTSTRLAIATILRNKGKVKHSVHANSESGIPLNILGLAARDYSPLDWVRLAVMAPIQLLFHWEKYDYYIVEMGIDSPRPPKNMEYLLSIVRPDVGVVLNAGLVHGAEFDYLVADRNPVRRAAKIRGEVAKEKMKLAYAVPKSGFAVVNNDQKELRDLAKKLKGRLVTVGSRVGSSLRIRSSSITKQLVVRYTYQSQNYTLQIPGLYEEAYAQTFLTAIAVAAGLGIPPDQSMLYLQKYQAPKGRLRLFEGKENTHLIDSSYNASPDTMKSALALLKKAAGRAHKIAILGDMRELGLQSKAVHKSLADWVKQSADECILFGKETGEYTLPVLESCHFPVRHFTKMSDLLDYLDDHTKKGSWILIKGSQNTIFLERVVEHLLADQHDISNLARRGVYWDAIRAKAA